MAASRHFLRLRWLALRTRAIATRRSLRVAAVIAFVASCGPVAYFNQVTLSADRAVEQARAAGAEKYSPYYWTRAVNYLHMAREVGGHADFQGATRFGRLAAQAAVLAKDEAELGAKDPSKLPYIHLEPAK